jgi:hypothetical protein
MYLKKPAFLLKTQCIKLYFKIIQMEWITKAMQKLIKQNTTE